MESQSILAIIATVVATSATAQTSNTTTIDRPGYSGTRTTIIDPVTGIASRDGTVMRKADGAVASREMDRTRTDTGVAIQGSSTNFAARPAMSIVTARAPILARQRRAASRAAMVTR